MELKFRLLSIFMLWCLLLFSQNDSISKYPLVKVYNKDTVIIFHINQGRELALQNEERKYLLELNGINEKQIVVLDSVITIRNSQVKDYEVIVDDFDTVIFEKNALIEICEFEKESLNKEIRKQKNMKIVFISTTVIVAVLGILF